MVSLQIRDDVIYLEGHPSQWFFSFFPSFSSFLPSLPPSLLPSFLFSVLEEVSSYLSNDPESAESLLP